MTSDLKPNADEMAQFTGAMFKNADPKGFISLRAYRDDGADDVKPIFKESILVGSPDLMPVIVERARQAACWDVPAVFCPPVATFQTAANAKTENLFEGVALSVECDQAASGAQQRLTEIIGEPTIVVASGGEWTDPETGEIEPKLHLHWRLTRPSREQ